MSNIYNDILIEDAQQLCEELGIHWFIDKVNYAIKINDLELLNELVHMMRDELKTNYYEEED